MLDRWLVERTKQLVEEATAGYERWLTAEVTRAADAFVDDLSNWYIRRSRRRFWDGDEVALRTLWHALVQAIRVLAPVMPFLTEHLWQTLVREPCEDAPASVHLAGWPEAATPDSALLGEIAAVRRVVGLGHQARQASGVKVQQPLRRTRCRRHRRCRARTLRRSPTSCASRRSSFGAVEADLRVKPNLPTLGPRLGKELGAVRAALLAGEFEELEGGRFRAGGHELEAEDVLVERAGREGWSVAAEDGVTVALDTTLDPELERERRVYELIRRVNTMRKETGLELTDRIHVTLSAADGDLAEYEDWIKRETLAVVLDWNGGDAPVIAKA